MDNEKRTLTYADYARAEKFLPWNQAGKIFNSEVKSHYLGKPGDHNETFWYVVNSSTGRQFKRVEPAVNRREPLFDEVRLAAALSEASGIAYTRYDLPFSTLEYPGGREIRFKAGEALWECDLDTYRLKQVEEPDKRKPGELISPDGKYAAFRRDYNLWVRSLETQEEFPLTTDGVQNFDYASSPESNTLAVTLRQFADRIPPLAVWSPDSKKLLTQRLDQRQVKDLHLLQNCPPEGQRPVLHTYKYAMVGDEHLTQEQIVILDVETRRCILAGCSPVDGNFMSAVELKTVWWGKDSSRAYYVYPSRDHKTVRFYEIDPQTGDSRLLMEETGKTYVELSPVLGDSPNIRVIKEGQEFIWPSERSGWFNLYRYDARAGAPIGAQTCALINPVASGPFVVWEIKHIDEENNWVYFTASGREPGRDPYYRHLYRVRLEGGEVELLTPEDAEHQITFSPNGGYFVDTCSRVDMPPVTQLRAADGELIRQLETADISQLERMGWQAPLVFQVMSRDGITPIYGTIYRPSHFDPSLKYPVVDSIYPGPQHNRTPKAFEPDPAQALAELGFIVVTIDGLGNMGRSKAYHDVSYGKFTEAGGLEDHITGLRQLAAQYPWMDLERVGIYGHSGGGFASTKAILTYPDFYKVAVSSAGNHDQRGYLAGWGELYNGLLEGDNFVAQANPTLAANLKGKLLLAAGDMDDNVHMAMTMQVVDALIKAGKDFDMLLLPNRNHSFARTDGYFIRRLWDYFVTHLLGAEPPKEYAIDQKAIPPMEFPA